VANVSRRFPQLLIALAESRISLTVAALLVPHLTEDNVDKLISLCWEETEGDRGVHRCVQAQAGFRALDPEAPCASGARGVAVNFNINVNITGASTSTRRDAEELPDHSAARP